MDKSVMEKIERIIKEREYSNNYLISRNSKAYNSFLELEKHAFSSGKLDKRIKELIALGISIVKNCESCIEWHIHQALESGASFEQIFESLDVAIEMGGGPATVSARFAISVIEYYQSKMAKE
jgi:AhpD family alkylhydroperoxidase